MRGGERKDLFSVLLLLLFFPKQQLLLGLLERGEIPRDENSAN